MKKFLSVLFVIILAFSMVTYGFASQQFSTEVTLTVGGDGGENPDPGPGTGGENPDPGPGTGGENPDPGPGTGGENPDPGPGTGGENPDPGPGTGGENPDPGTGGENPGPGTGGENHKPSRPSGNSGRPNRPNRPSGGSANNSSHNPSLMPSTPTGAKPGGIDAEGNPYYLIDGVHVAAGIRENGYMYGFSNMTFGPDKFLTRAQFAAIMDRIFVFDEVDITKSFEDTRGHWAEEHINRLASRGVILGVSSTEFRPNGGLTKGHVLLMLSRVLDIAKYSNVSDLPSVKQYHAKEAVARMLNSGIYDEIDADFDVNARITRAEMVHLLNNIIYERNVKSARTERLLMDNQIFPDLIQNQYHMYYNDCVKALEYNYLLREVSKFER